MEVELLDNKDAEELLRWIIDFANAYDYTLPLEIFDIAQKYNFKITELWGCVYKLEVIQ